MVLTQKEQATIQDLMTQEKECIKKYEKYGQQAQDPVLTELFNTLKQKEEQHYNSLQQVLTGEVPDCDCNDDHGKNYTPKATYTGDQNAEAKKNDCFLATDAIGTEKLVSGEYNSDVFAFEDSGIRKLLADIQIEEQNHAEMLYKYKTANKMA